MIFKRIFMAIIVIGLLTGCVTQKPERTYTLNVYILGSTDSYVVISTEAVVDKTEDVKTNQNINPDINVDPAVIP